MAGMTSEKMDAPKAVSGIYMAITHHEIRLLDIGHKLAKPPANSLG